MVTKLVLLSILCESVWQTLKMVWQKDKYVTVDNVGSIIISVIVCVATNLDILKLLEIDSSIPYLGVILSGILISRGSNFIHDILNKLKITSNPVQLTLDSFVDNNLAKQQNSSKEETEGENTVKMIKEDAEGDK